MINDSNNSNQQKIKDKLCYVKELEPVISGVYRIRFENPFIALHALPGQFVNIRVSRGITPLLRRPFSIHRRDAKKGLVDILFDLRGIGTQKLSMKGPDRCFRVLGPLGKSFSFPNQLEKAIIVAGGIGVAPFLFLADALKNLQIPTLCYFGARTKRELYRYEEFKKLGIALELATDDGSFGYQGYVTELLRATFFRKVTNPDKVQIYACGPPAMLRAVQQFSLDHQIPAQLSLEAMMGCGFGICVGCAVPMALPLNNNPQYKLVCQDGPIFSAEEVIIPD